MKTLVDTTGRRCLCGHVESSHRFRPLVDSQRRLDCLQCECGRFAWDNQLRLPPRPTSPPATPPVASGAGGRLAKAEARADMLSTALHTANRRLRDLGDRMGSIPIPGCPCLECVPPPAPARAPGSVFDEIDRAADNYRYEHRLPRTDVLVLVVAGGVDRLAAAGSSLLGGVPLPSGSVLAWLRSRYLELVPVHNYIGQEVAGELEFLIYKAGTWVPEPDTRAAADLAEPVRVRLPRNAVAHAIAQAPRRLQGATWTIAAHGEPGEEQIVVCHTHFWRQSTEDGRLCLWIDPDGQRCAAPYWPTETSLRAVWWSLPRTISVASIRDDNAAEERTTR